MPNWKDSRCFDGAMLSPASHSRALLEGEEDRVEARLRELREAADVAHGELALHVRHEEAEGREHARGRGDHGGRAPEEIHQGVRVERAGAAERDEGEPARVVASLDGDEPQPAQHLLVRDRDDREGGLLEGGAEALRDLPDGAGGEVEVECHATPEQAREVAEDGVRVRHRRLLAAVAVAGRPRVRARCPTKTAARTPPAGPDKTVSTGRAPASAALIRPPSERTTWSAARGSRSASPCRREST